MLRWTRRAQRGGGPTDGSYLSRPGPADRSRCLKPAPRAAARCPALGGARPGVGRGALHHGLPLTPPRHGALRSGVWRRCFFFLGAAAAACPAPQTRGASAVAAAARPARALPTDCRPCPPPPPSFSTSNRGRGAGGAAAEHAQARAEAPRLPAPAVDASRRAIQGPQPRRHRAARAGAANARRGQARGPQRQAEASLRPAERRGAARLCGGVAHSTIRWPRPAAARRHAVSAVSDAATLNCRWHMR